MVNVKDVKLGKNTRKSFAKINAYELLKTERGIGNAESDRGPERLLSVVPR